MGPDTFVVFTVDGFRYALPVSAVRRTLPFPRVSRLPAVGPHVVGVFQSSGRVMALWDLHALFAATGDPPAAPWVVVTEHAGRLLGLAVAQVDEVVGVQEAHIEPAGVVAPTAARPAVLGVLAAPLRDPEADAPADPIVATDADATAGEGLDALLQAGRADRGAERLAALHPVHLLDLAALRRLGGEGGP